MPRPIPGFEWMTLRPVYLPMEADAKLGEEASRRRTSPSQIIRDLTTEVVAVYDEWRENSPSGNWTFDDVCREGSRRYNEKFGIA